MSIKHGYTDQELNIRCAKTQSRSKVCTRFSRIHGHSPRLRLADL